MSEKQFCSKCEYYYSEMFTCPICYGAEQERKRRNAWLLRVQTMYEEKAGIWYEGYEQAFQDIFKLIETSALDYVDITCNVSGHGATFDD